MKSRRKQEWDNYMTDGNRFKVTKEELEKKKKLLESKHNILADSYQPPKLSNKSKSKLKKLAQESIQEQENNLENIAADSLSGGKSSLDLLALDSDNEDNNMLFTTVTPKKATKPSTITTPRTPSKMKSPHHSSSHSVEDSNKAEQRRMISRSPLPTKQIHYSSMANIITPSKQKTSFISTDDKLPDEDIAVMMNEIRTLLTELRYYEEISGRKSILDQEVKSILSFSSSFVIMSNM